MVDVATYSLKSTTIPRHQMMIVENLDMSWDFTDEFNQLDDGDSIAEHLITVNTLAQYQASQQSATKVVAFISGSGGVVNQSYLASCKITTALGRVYQRDRWIQIVSSR